MVLKTHLFIKNILLSLQSFCKESEIFLINKCVFNTILYLTHYLWL